jgi:hypothetical protein
MSSSFGFDSFFGSGSGGYYGSNDLDFPDDDDNQDSIIVRI